MMGFVATKTVSSGKNVPSVEEQIPMVARGVPIGSYVIHKLQPNDTLDRICLIYDVPKDAIRKANNFTGDEVYMKRELIIPNSAGPVLRVQTDTTDERRKQDMIELMSIHIKEKIKSYGSYQPEAKYYLEIHAYDFAKAI
jgi:LysM repeat protein